jgi:peptidoglycan hydrolase-like protein with peptidoglycan-binding domain
MAERSRWFLAGAASCACVVVAAAAVVVSVQGIVADARASRPTRTVQDPTTTVSTGPVQRTVEGDVSVTAESSSVPEPPQSTAGDDRAVVTRTGARPGAVLKSGDVIATIAERPTLLLHSDVPFFRTLGAGVEGRDVGALQRALNALGYGIAEDARNEYGPGTARAVFFLYRDRGYQPVAATGRPVDVDAATTTVAPSGEVFAASTLPVTPRSQCGVAGGHVDGPVCSLQTATGSPRLTVAAVEADMIRAGQHATIALDDGSTVEATVRERLEADSEDPDTETAGADDADLVDKGAADDVAFGLDTPEQMSGGTTGTATIVTAESPANGLRIEEIAIRSRGAATWLVAADGATLPVKRGLCAAGLCVVTGPRLEPGLRIRLPHVAG